MPFLAEPTHAHDQPPKVGILITNLGTPAAPTQAAVRRYLAEFLSDKRVVEIPALLWKAILHGVVLRTRPKKSAANYAKIWMENGSPLLVHSIRQKQLLEGQIGERLKQEGLAPDSIKVALGMRYGSPSIAEGIAALRAEYSDRLLVLPLYPQYASSTTASTLDAVGRALGKIRRIPAFRMISSFHDHPGYIKALISQVNYYWNQNGRPDRLVLSFHGLPKSSLNKGDPYFCHCHKTARLLTEGLGWEKERILVSFQSRFGWAEWLKPYTESVLKELGQQGVPRVDVFCPGFVADCLETLEEIALQGKKAFLMAGGQALHVIPCLNENPDWIGALADIAWENLGGWLKFDAGERRQQKALAERMGAPQ